MVRLLASAALALSAASAIYAQQAGGQNSAGGSGPKCGAGSLCPQDSPCCSQYGQCGVGAFCLGGCDPIHSHSLNSCTPKPTCQDRKHIFENLDSISPNTEFLGDSSKAEWVSSGTPKQFNNSVLLTLSEDGASAYGTLLASTEYVWYGKVGAYMKSSRGAGVVSAFILLSDVKDEIDYEFVGADLTSAQSNFYFQGITDYHQGKNLSVNGADTFNDWHLYEIDWQPDQIVWSVDNSPMRTVKKSDTYNDTDKQYHYPQTPARVQLSLWPAGNTKNGQGTIDWAGGLVNWNTQDVQNNGYYYAMFQSVNVTCYDPPSGTKQSGKAAYGFTSTDGVQSSVEMTNDNTVLKSFLGSGENMDKDYPKPASASGSASASASATPTNLNTIPGLSGAGPGSNGQRPGNSGSDGSGQNSGDTGASGSASAGGASPTAVGGFTQGDGGKKGNGAAGRGEDLLRGSALAGIVAIGALLVI